MSNTKEQTEWAVIEKTIFDTMYKKKITLKDALYTKGGLISLLIIIYLATNGELEILHVVLWIVFIFFIIKKSTILAHTKDRNLWGKKLLFQLFSELQQKKNREKNDEIEIILKACEKKKVRRLNRQRKAQKNKLPQKKAKQA